MSIVAQQQHESQPALVLSISLGRKAEQTVSLTLVEWGEHGYGEGEEVSPLGAILYTMYYTSAE